MQGTLLRPVRIAGTVLTVTTVWVLATNWDAVWNGHPSYPLLYAGFAGVGLAAAFTQGPRRRVAIVLATPVIVLAAVTAWWLSPFAAEPDALAALESSSTVSVTTTATAITLEPASDGVHTGLIFRPGARVDARAYVALLRPMAEQGFRVVIAKEPLGIGFLAPGFTEGWIEDHPAVERWVLAGHSLGGVVAASEAADVGDGLLLWASYPASDISTADIAVTSIYGTADGLSEPSRVLASRSDLPEDARFVPIEGAIHSHFGDYGDQPGDGEPGIDREAAQDRIVASSLELLRIVDSPA